MYIVKMKSLFLLITCTLLMLLASVERMGDSVCSAQTTSINDMQEDMLYDDDEVTLLSTYTCQHDDVVPRRINSWGAQLRVLTSRIQWRCQLAILLVKKLTHLLSAYLTTLINHISQFYSSIHSLCWQYAADCYVFAYRQILI